MPEPPDRMPPHRKQVERRRAMRGPTGTGSKEWVATGCAGIDVPGQRGTNWPGQRGTNWHGQRRDKRRRAGMGCTRMDGHEAKDGRARSKGTDGADSKGSGGADNMGTGADNTRPVADNMGTGGVSKPRHRKRKTRSAEAERVIGTVGSPTPGGRSGGTERQPFLIEAISWAGVACR